MSRLVENYIKELFDEKDVSPENREKLWKYYNDKLSKGVDVGWNSSFEIDDKDLVQSLKSSIAKFSAFKETAFKKDVEALLTRDGKLMPWSEFKKESAALSVDYNARWLETEYHQTIAQANAAAQWKDFEQNVDLYPNLKLVSVNDARVRPEHKVLNGTIRPFDDPFWNTNTPPLDWGCRCHLEQTDDEATEIKGGVQMKIEFENNPGKTGEIFGGTAYEKRLDKTEIKAAKKNAEKWSKDRKNIDFKTMSIDEMQEKYVNQNIDELKEKLIMNNQTGYVANSNSFFINEKLRNNLDVIDEFKPTVAALDDLISKNIIDENIILFRNDGLGFIESHFKTSISGMDVSTAVEHLNKLKPKNISTGGFTSTSAVKDINAFTTRKIHSEIRVKKGTNAYITKNFTESEIILGRDQKFKIVEIKEEGGKIKIILETD